VRRSPEAIERLAPLLVLFLASLLIYGRTLSYPFVLDDRMVIVHNEFLRSPASLPLLLVSDYSRGTTFGPGYFRPLMMITFALQGLLFGWSPGPFHLVNVLLHALAAWALYLTARAFGCGARSGLAGALLFTVFPPASESAGSIVGRCDILATLFFLLGWRAQILWQRGRMSTVRACVSGFGLLAMLGKENAAVYTAATAVTAVCFLLAARDAGSARLPGRGARGQLLICAAACTALAAYLLLRLVAVGGIGLTAAVSALSSNPVASLAQPERTYAALYGTGRLLLALLGTSPPSVPLPLVRGRPLPLEGPLDARVLLPGLLLVLILILAGRLVRRGRPEGAALAFFLMTLLPVSNLVVAGASFVGGRFLYLPFAGLALAAAIGFDRVSLRAAAHPRIAWLCPVLVGALISGWSVLAFERVTDWRSEEAIAESWERQFPWDVLGWNHSGMLALERGDLSKARESFERSVTIDPSDAGTLANLGRILGKLGLWKDSSERLRRAAELQPAAAEIRTELAQALLALGEKQAALEEARAAHELRPSLFAGRHAFATALFENGRFGEAAWEFQRLILIDPENAPLHHAYILSLYRDGRFEEARTAAGDASRRVPADPQFDLWKARLAVRLGRRDQAIADLEEAKRKGGPVGLWLERVGDLKALRDDPRARALAGAE